MAIKKKRPKLKIFGYKTIYSDAKASTRRKGVVYSRLLRSERYGLTGKPDYIMKRRLGRALIPVELKSGSNDGTMPHKGDMLQLAAYFVIIQEEFNVKPRKGRIIYADSMFIVKNTKALRCELFNTMDNMRRMLSDRYTTDVLPNYPKCRHCLCRETVCDVYGK